MKQERQGRHRDKARKGAVNSAYSYLTYLRYVGNLDFPITEEELQAFFADAMQVVAVK